MAHQPCSFIIEPDSATGGSKPAAEAPFTLQPTLTGFLKRWDISENKWVPKPMFCQKHMFCIPVQDCLYFLCCTWTDRRHYRSVTAVLAVLALQGGGWRRKTPSGPSFCKASRQKHQVTTLANCNFTPPPPPSCNPPPLAIPPPMGLTVNWPKKHRKHEAPKKIFLQVTLELGLGGDALGAPPPPHHGGGPA